MDTSIVFDRALIAKYDHSGPRYTSYPTAVQFHEQFAAAEYIAAARHSNASGRPLSLYVHIPFCACVCYYCACNKIITANRRHADPYLQRLLREIELQGQLFDASRSVEQLHWGGGTPTFLTAEQMQRLMDGLRQHFSLREDDGGDYSIEIDPREASPATITQLRQLGFNRLSLGVQDFEPAVQQAVNRIQSQELTLEVLQAAREAGFRSINLDLIYGLPHQSETSFNRTLEAVLAVNPDRLSVFNYAHLPQLFKTQRQIDESALPSAAEKLAILQSVIARLTAAGYVYIGMDHFARPEDPLAQAQRAGKLHRNFQGYTTHADCDLIGLGLTSIGMLDGSYSQNLKEMEAYHAALDAEQLPVFRGVRLTEEDKLRRALITRLICDFALDGPAVAAAWGVDFQQKFAPELERLSEMAADGLLSIEGSRIQVLPAGRLLIRNICMVFDQYLAHVGERRFSKVI